MACGIGIGTRNNSKENYSVGYLTRFLREIGAGVEREVAAASDSELGLLFHPAKARNWKRCTGIRVEEKREELASGGFAARGLDLSSHC
jgi:hypothetical protein